MGGGEGRLVGGGIRECWGVIREWQRTGKVDKRRLLQALKSLVGGGGGM